MKSTIHVLAELCQNFCVSIYSQDTCKETSMRFIDFSPRKLKCAMCQDSKMPVSLGVDCVECDALRKNACFDSVLLV